MALSNIFQEPRREITESAIGIAIFVIFLYLDYAFAIRLRQITQPINGGCPIFLGMILIPIFGLCSALIIWMVLHCSHLTGESICNRLAKNGIELRPKRRYRDQSSNEL